MHYTAYDIWGDTGGHNIYMEVGINKLRKMVLTGEAGVD